MSGMSSMMDIALYRDAPSPDEPNRKGDCRSGCSSRESCSQYTCNVIPLSFGSLREGL